jgi:hypothetical protein
MGYFNYPSFNSCLEIVACGIAEGGGAGAMFTCG